VHAATESRGQRLRARSELIQRGPPIELGIQREHNVIEALASVLRFFDREQEFLRRLLLFGEGDPEIYAVFEVEYCFGLELPMRSNST